MVAFGASDGAILRGQLHSVPGPKRRIAIFVAPAQDVWRAQALGFVGPGTDVLLFDMRGYGASTERPDPSKLDLDVEAAVRFMKSRDYPLVYLIGADAGGTAVLKVAARQELAAVITVSAPLFIQNQNGIDARPDLQAITEPKVFVAARGDEAAVNAVNAMMQAAPQPKQSVIVEGTAHGAALLDANIAKQLQAELMTR
jgi:alpha-beta hydrolase superfamily lysophospholipase